MSNINAWQSGDCLVSLIGQMVIVSFHKGFFFHVTGILATKNDYYYVEPEQKAEKEYWESLGRILSKTYVTFSKEDVKEINQFEIKLK